MVGCSAPNCSNRAARGGFKMKRFPADRTVRQIWINNVRRADWNWNPPADFRNCRICEVHFDEDQFEDKSLDGSLKRFKSGAIPTLFNVTPSPEVHSVIPSFPGYCSRRRKKIVGNYDPTSMCASNLNPISQQISSVHQSSNNSGDSPHSSIALIQEQFDRRKQKGNLATPSLPVASYMTEQPDFSHSSNQIQFHERFENNRAISLAFSGRDANTVRLSSIPISTSERFNMFQSVATTSRINDISEAERIVNNVQTMLEPGEIKLEYIADSPVSGNEEEQPSDKSISSRTCFPSQSNSKECIPTTTLEEMAKDVVTHEKYKNLSPALHPLFSVGHQENNPQASVTDLSQSIKVDYDFPMSEPDSGLSSHYPKLTVNQSQSTPNILPVVAPSLPVVTSSLSSPIEKDLKFLANFSESNLNEKNQGFNLKKQKKMLEDLQTSATEEDLKSASNCSNLAEIQISSKSHFLAPVNKSLASKQTKTSIHQKYFKPQSKCEQSTEKQCQVEHLRNKPISQLISYSASSVMSPEKRNCQPFRKRRNQYVRQRKKIFDRNFWTNSFKKKLTAEKQKSRKLRIENQKLRKELRPLRSLQHWIAKFVGANHLKLFENLQPRERTFESLQKSLKTCSVLCGYLSSVVSLPFYSTQARPV